MIKVLIQGEHKNLYKKKSYIINPLTSAITLIKSGEFNILVDTGSPAFENKLIKELNILNLTPDDINYVILTHYHIDHTANSHLFKKALIYTPKAILDMKSGQMEIFNCLEEQGSPPGVKIIDTKGHTPDDISVLYQEKEIRYMMTGDAFREDIVTGESVLTAKNKVNYKKSLKKILKLADTIIPGHGRIIEGDNLNKIKKLFLK